MTNARDQLLADIERFLIRHGMRATKLGADALGDTAFVSRLRGGRDPHLSTADRVRAWMADYEKTKRVSRARPKRSPARALATA